MRLEKSILQNAHADFIGYIATEKGLSNNSIEAYSRDTQYFIDYLVEGQIYDLNNITTDHLIGFLDVMRVNQYADATLYRTLIALKVFFKFLKREKAINDNVSIYLESPKLWQTIPDILSVDEIELLLQQPDLTTSVGMRDKAIIELLYSSGLRVSELCSLSIYSVSDEYVRVMGKGRKERLVPIGKRALGSIDAYLSNHRHISGKPEEQHLFLTTRGKPIDRIAVWKMIKKYAAQAQIEKIISPHTFRHSFATHLLDNGADLRIIQEMLGHGHISSTDRYTHVSSTHLQNAFQRCHPRQLPSGK